MADIFRLASDYLLWGIVLHLVADWVFQNDWIARFKSRLNHCASWVHGAIHFVAMLVIFAPHVALIIALIHMLIDTRIPVRWWQGFYHQTADGPYAIHVQIWLDQVIHIGVLALASLWVAHT